MNKDHFLEKVKPKKEFKNFESYVDYFRCKTSQCDIVKYPCFQCMGDKKVKDIRQLDPVEGLKHADFIKCKSCDGSGDAGVEKYKEKYKKYQTDPHLFKIKKYKSLKNTIKALTKEQFESLLPYLTTY